MRVGLVGSPSSPGLRFLKREIEDRGHRAAFIGPRKFPQYVTGGIACRGWRPVSMEKEASRAGSAGRRSVSDMGAGVGGACGDAGCDMAVQLDHADLLSFACFYLHDFEIRDGFFRGEFGEDTWVTLRERYLDYARSEVDNLAFQVSLLACLGEARPMVNPPRSLAMNRLRPSIYFRLARAGLPVVSHLTESSNGQDRQSGHSRPAPPDHTTLRIRIAEDNWYDVPCFPRNLGGITSVRAVARGSRWRVLTVAHSEAAKMILADQGGAKAMDQPREAAELGQRVLAALGLEVAEIDIDEDRGGLKVFDVLPSPDISEFEEITGERFSGLIAERLLLLGGSK